MNAAADRLDDLAALRESSDGDDDDDVWELVPDTEDPNNDSAVAMLGYKILPVPNGISGDMQTVCW